ncbi:TIGR03751 family conjugal transfer lipoprotein [Legionella taurinensis]|uniref:TIGR03751 family conjugal transfer lipoprotein n=2 Tax=Legionella TaxID=445 RepID=UPI00299E885F|nr:TIGR03751 family conjugal transfer lipoprotein [Legionella taurinensis]MDX1838113.1 TIGR03751 family conjugal transfer lipoprotein [Legionella taurinensis]
MVTYNTIRMILVSSSLLLLSSCAKSVASGTIPEEGLTVSQIYNQSVATSAPSWTAPRYKRTASGQMAVNYQGETRTAANETKALFKALDNPAIPIYIYPHVALIGDEQLVKPGFTTEFFLYKQNQFALASERY